MTRNSVSRSLFCATLGFFLGVPLLCRAAQQQGDQQVDLRPRMNVVFLDDAAEALPAGVDARRNHWPEWNRRLPVFKELLSIYVAKFREAAGERARPDDSLFALEVAAGLSTGQKDSLIAGELERISTATKRPSAILARGTAGGDQLRLVFQDQRNYTPAHAARFLRLLAEVSPRISHTRMAERLGPFQPPPTIVFDPRGSSLISPADASERAKHRWGLLEDDAYLLPQYVLHSLAVLDHQLSVPETMFADTTREAGTNTFKLVVGTGNDAETFAFNNAAPGRKQEVVSVAQFNRIVSSGFAPNTDYFINPRSGEKINDGISSLSSHGLNYESFTLGNKGYNQAKTEMPSWSAKPTLIEPLRGYTGFVDGSKAREVLQIGGGKVIMTETYDNAALLQKLVTQAKSTGDLKNLDIKILVAANADLGISGRLGKISIPIPIQGPAKSALLDGINSSGRLDYRHFVSGSVTQETGGTKDVLNSQTMQQLQRTHEHGGIVFHKDNIYVVDVTGYLCIEGEVARAAVDRGEKTAVIDGKEVGVGGLQMTEPEPATARKPVHDVVMLWLDAVRPRHGTLPFALPRFLTSDEAGNSRLGGPWNFEPLTLSRRVDATDQEPGSQTIEVVVFPAETANRLAYEAAAPAAEKSSQTQPGAESLPLYFIKDGSTFQPPLTALGGGGFLWTLRHGVTIEFDAAGLVRAIRSPRGEGIRYLRHDAQLLEQRTADGRSLAVSYRQERPVAVTAGQEKLATYEYADSGELVAVGTERGAASIRYENGRPAKIASDGWTLALSYSRERRITGVTAGSTSVTIRYVDEMNSIQVSAAGQPTVDWRFWPDGKVSGVVMGDRAIFWTRSIDGRIIQMACGRFDAGGEAGKFVPTEVIGTIPQ